MLFKKVLALSPHSDDIEIGAGGTIAKLAEAGADVTVFIFSAPEPVSSHEYKDALKILGVSNFELLDFKPRHFPLLRQGILDYLYNYDQENKVDLVLTPSTTDRHQDHKTITDEAIRAFKNSTILGYILPRNNLALREDCFVELDERHVEKKVKAQRCYESQISLRPNQFSEEYIKAKVIARGPNIGVKYAEGFELIKLVLRRFS